MWWFVMVSIFINIDFDNDGNRSVGKDEYWGQMRLEFQRICADPSWFADWRSAEDTGLVHLQSLSSSDKSKLKRNSLTI